MTAPTTDPELEQVAWDLSHLLDGDVDAMLDTATARAGEFAERYRGQLAELDGTGLAEAMRAVGDIEDIVGRAFSYAALRFSTNTADPARGALLQKVQERATVIQTQLVFWELEWAALDDERAEELLAHEELDFCRHHLRSARR
jgi:oligoendopeptidase F